MYNAHSPSYTNEKIELMPDTKKIAIVIPCHNEQHGIGKVLDSIPREKLLQRGYITQILVIDNNSTDRTAAIAKKRGATVIREEKKGKGNALKTGFLNVDNDASFVVMLDGDFTYNPKEILRMIEPLESHFCDVVVGSRLGGKIHSGSLKSSNRLVNWGYTFLIRHMYNVNVTDVLSGYFAWRKDVVDHLLPHIESRGFSIEVDMITKISLLGYQMYSVPITYDVREGESKISAITDGLKILGVLILNMIWRPHINASRRTIFIGSIKRPFLYVKQIFTPYERSKY